jgi:polygalacturonase
MYGIRIKTPRGRGGIVQDILFRNNRMTDVETPMVFSAYYTGAGYDEAAVAKKLSDEGGFVLGHQIYPADTDPAQSYKPNSTPWIRKVRVENLTATGANRAGIVVGLPERSIEGLVFENVNISSKKGLLVRNAQVEARGLKVTTADGKPLITEHGARVSAGNRP